MNISALIGAVTALVAALGTLIGVIRHVTGPAHLPPPGGTAPAPPAADPNTRT